MGGGGRYGSKLIFGVNRYYGRNLLSYKLYEYAMANTISYERDSPNSTWKPINQGREDGEYAFNKLKVPHDDEVMVGFTQNIYMFELVGKYIYRGGRDEVMQVKQDKKTTWSNDGKSESHIISLMISNKDAIEAFGVQNYFNFGFDYAKTSRSYNLYNIDDAYLENQDIIYDGQIIKYRDRPVENYARPFSIKLSTTTIFNIWKTRWTYNNFFSYRDKFERMVLLSNSDPNFNPQYSDLEQYGKVYIDGAFTWDIRIGFEIDIYKGHTLYCNLDIYNVLNAKNMATLSAVGGAIPDFASSSSVAVYEIGRQFWLQVGYKI